MPDRRDILKQTCAAALGLLGAPYISRAAGSGIRSLVRHDETILRLGGVGDGYKMTWAADDRQGDVSGAARVAVEPRRL